MNPLLTTFKNKITICTIFCLLILHFPLFSQQTFKVALGTASNEYGNYVMETSDSGFLTVGYSDAGANEDGVVIKLDQQGVVQWSKTLGSSTLNDRLFGCTELNGFYYVVGRTNDTPTRDAWCAKLDLSGNLIWSKLFNSALAAPYHDDGFYKILPTSGNRLLITGYTEGQTDHKYASLYMVKIDDSGTVLWEKNYTNFTHQTNTSYDMILTPSGNVVFVGWTYCYTSSNDHDGIAVCIDTASGNRIWTRTYGRAGGSEDRFLSITNTKDGNALCSGYANLDGTYKHWLVKIDLSNQGNVLWQRSYHMGTAGTTYKGLVSTTNNNDFMIALTEYSNSPPTLATRTSFVRIDSAGSILYSKIYDGPQQDELSYIINTSTNHHVAIGKTNSFGAGNFDFYIIKTNSFGNIDSCCVLSGAAVTNTTALTINTLQSQDENLATNNSVFSPVNNTVTIQKAAICNPILSQSSINAVICLGNTYPFPGNPGSSGVYKDTLTNQFGCDSIITLNLTVIPPSNTTLNATICQGTTYPFPGNPGVSGTYIDTLTNQFGCDSIITLILTVTPPSNTTLNATICQGTTSPFPGNPGVSGTYTDTLTNQFGCDSVITLNLTVMPASATTLNATICQGDTYPFPGNPGTAGVYIDSLINQFGCDSVVMLNLSVSPTSNNTVSAEICYGSSYALPGGTIVNSSGQYNDTLTNKYGCDSILVTNLSVKNEIDNLSIPNVFTPNNDGNNDQFTFGINNSDCITNMNIIIYNRWGIKIYESAAPVVSWDGIISSGSVAHDGTYYYILSYQNIAGETSEKTGFLSLLR